MPIGLDPTEPVRAAAGGGTPKRPGSNEPAWDEAQEALALAVREGGCRIRIGDQVAALVATDELDDREVAEFLAHPVIAERLTRAARSLDEIRE